LPALRATKSSPTPSPPNSNSGGRRLSEQVKITAQGLCPLATSSRCFRKSTAQTCGAVMYFSLPAFSLGMQLDLGQKDQVRAAAPKSATTAIRAEAQASSHHPRSEPSCLNSRQCLPVEVDEDFRMERRQQPGNRVRRRVQPLSQRVTRNVELLSACDAFWRIDRSDARSTSALSSFGL
jgi:hypothetical protein